MNTSEGRIPPHLSEEQLKKLVLEAIDDSADENNPETFHALFGHLDRGLQTDDVLHGLEQEWQFDRPPCFNKFHWQWKYYIDTENVDGGRILIIIAVDTLDRSFEVITRWRQQA
jgi:hypothetical protein